MPLPRWIVPKNPRRVWVLLAIGTMLVGWRLLAAQGYLDWNSRVQDKVQALTSEDRQKFDQALDWLYDESGVDARVELLPNIGQEPLEQYTLRHMRQLRLGGESARRGLLLVYDQSSRRTRIEVGADLEGVLTDAFVGHINRDNLGQYLSADEVRAALDPEQFSEALPELVLAQIPRLEAAHEAHRLGLPAEQALDGIRVESLFNGEGAKGLEHVGGQDAAEVDEQPPHPAWATSRAFSASAGTPSSKSARYGSSVEPDVKRL